MNDAVNHLNDKFAAEISELSAPSGNQKFRFNFPGRYREFFYQIAINLVLLVFFSFNLDQSEQLSFDKLFAPFKLAFFTNYLAAATTINYVLLPGLYYKKRTLLFVIATIMLITINILVDEWILEPIFFPDTRARYFPGLAFTLVETLPIIIIMVAFKLAWDFNKKQREVENLKSLMRESEIQFLKSQINPHFLFNNLNNLYAYAIDHSPKTPAIILDLSNVLRYMLYDCRENFVPLTKEIQHLRNYTALHQLQIENRGSVRFHEEISAGAFAIPPLVLMVFVENAFKHSAGSQSHDVAISMDLRATAEGLLTFHCVNNYAAQYQVTGTARGIGLQNVRQRLELLYPGRYELHIDDDGKNYCVTLTLQLKSM